MSRRLVEITVILVISIVAYSYFGEKIDKNSVRGKRVLITGGSQNIGEEIAYQYSKLGARIVVTSRREEVLQSVVAKCLKFGAMQAEYVTADMSDSDVYQTVVDESAKKLGGLDIVVLNHVMQWNRTWTGSPEEIIYARKSTVVNYLSYVEMASAAMPILKHSEGQLIVVASLAGKTALSDYAAYGATKAAVINFFSSIQVEQMRYGELHPGITICILGGVDTEEARIYAKRSNMKMTNLHSVSDTATEIIEGGLRNDRYTYVPGFVGVFSPIREMFPSGFDKFLLYVMFE